MADFAFDPSVARRASDPYDGQDYEIELSALPRTRAPSYVSRNSAWNDEGDISLIKHDCKSSKSGLNDTERVVRVVSQTPAAASKRQKRRKLQGWRFGVTCYAFTAFLVLMLNLILTIIAATKFGSAEGVGTVFTGSCDTVNSWTTWLHVLINALSSILLSASNYTMQCLCSPTRKEIDEAHAKGDWMDIGVASVRNIWKIRWTRQVVWWCLALSSVPIHLLYNSAIFKALDANVYIAATVNSDFLTGLPFDKTIVSSQGSINSIIDIPALQGVQSFFAENLQNASLVQNFTNSDCIAAYGTAFVSGHSHVLMITSAHGEVSNDTVFSFDQGTYSKYNGGGGPPYDWICTDTVQYLYTEYCDIASVRRQASDWSMNHAKIDYCLAQISPSHCKLQFSLHILVTVIVMNACKSVCMFLTLYQQKDETLVTIGDALSSFLDRPDERTKGRCLMAKVDMSKGPLRWRASGVENTPNTNPLPVTYYAPIRRHWFAGATVLRWCITMGLCAGALMIGCALLAVGAAGTQNFLSGQSVFSLGFGAVDSRSMININLPQGGASGLVSAVLLANLPQATVSFLYLTYNGLFTLPLLVASGTLHWLISESIFLARISVYSNGETSDQDDYSEVGYSCLPILCVVLLGTAMLFCALGMGCRKFASSMPVAGSCSVALAAACHPPEHDEDAAFLPVRWGELVDVSGEDDEIRHCSFTSEEVQAMTPGRLYAGLRHDVATASDLRPRQV
ncbi:hypothetical protein LTR17_023785 [Elasticomyces elasticus]|nr:hypothetical protein LTR17_023785 [Elasticomyces elasticus]